jgi:hypothetical protein
MDNLLITNKTKQVLIAILVGIMVIIIAILTIIILNINLFVNILTFWLLTTFYSLFAFFLVDSPIMSINTEKIIEKPVYRNLIQVVEKPVIQEIQIPMENKVIEVVEKEVPVERIIYRTIEKKPIRHNIPKYEFIGSTQTKTYHKRTCKFSKMLKRKYKLHSNNKLFFKRKDYKACKSCLKK